MATFNNITSGFDVEVLIDQTIIKYIIQFFRENEELFQNETNNFLKNLSNIDRNYDLFFESTLMEKYFHRSIYKGEYMQIIEVEGNSDFFYLAISPLDFPYIVTLIDNPFLTEDFLDLYLILRIGYTINFSEIIGNIQTSDGEYFFDVYGESIRFEGIMSGLHIQNNVSEEGVLLVADTPNFKLGIRTVTETIYTAISDLQDAGDIDMPAIFDSIFEFLPEERLFSSEEYFEIFLTGLHNYSGINGLLREAVEGVEIASPFVFNEIRIQPYREDNKIGLYANFNTDTIIPPLIGNLSAAQIFAQDATSGVGLNFTENRLQSLLLSIMKFVMQKRLGEEIITKDRFDAINFSYPFLIPSELFVGIGGLENLIGELPEEQQEPALEAITGIDFLEIKKIKLKFKKHKFANQDGKIDAIRLEAIINIIADNIAPELGAAMFKAFTANPHVKVFIGFDITDGDLKILSDIDVSFPVNFTDLLIMPFIVKLIMNAILAGMEGANASEDLSSLTEFTILKKRWDPFYTTNHNIKLDAKSIKINELEDKEPQVKLLLKPKLTKRFSLYSDLYIKEVEFDEAGFLQRFLYKLDSVEDINLNTIPATDRIVDIYDINNLSNEIEHDFTPSVQRLLKDRAASNKIYTGIRYRPQLVRFSGSTIASIGVLSDHRRQELKQDFVNEYVENEIQKIVDLFIKLLLVLIPDYDVDAITEEQLQEIKDSIEELIKDTEGYKNYKDEKWEDDLVDYLKRNTDEMLILSPLQLVLMGMTSPSVQRAVLELDIASDEIFSFLEMTNYQAIALGVLILIRNKPNKTNIDNLATLPEF